MVTFSRVNRRRRLDQSVFSQLERRVAPAEGCAAATTARSGRTTSAIVPLHTTSAIVPLHTRLSADYPPTLWMYDRSSMTRWREVLTLYTYEIRSALRERTIVINSIVIPMVLYPAMLWITFTGIEFVRGQTADQTSRVSRRRPHRRASGSRAVAPSHTTPGDRAGRRRSPSSPERSVTSGALDAVLQFQPAPADRVPGQRCARGFSSMARARGATRPRVRLREALRVYRERRLREEAFARGITAAAVGGLRARRP